VERGKGNALEKGGVCDATNHQTATAHDAAGVQAIYAPIVRDTAVSSELEPPGMGEVRQRIEATLPRMPWLVCGHGDEILSQRL
jgi:L-amino acid N-acyltransferase YncA